MSDRDYLDLTLAEFLGQVAAATPDPGAGAVVATTVGLAAGLTAMSAGLSARQLTEADQLAARARELQEQSTPLGHRDAVAYSAVLTAQARPKDDPDRPMAIREALSGAADVPLEIARVGADVLELAVIVAARGNPNLRGDALTACMLAQAAIRAAAVLVELNLADAADPRRVRAAELASSAQNTRIPE